MVSDIPAWDGKIDHLFLQCRRQVPSKPSNLCLSGTDPILGMLSRPFPLRWGMQHLVVCTLLKKVSDFPFSNYSRPVRVWLVTSRLGAGKSLTFFYSVQFDLQHFGTTFYINFQHFGTFSVYSSTFYDKIV